MKINFNETLKNLDGTNAIDINGKGLKQSDALATALANSMNSDDALKHYHWALKIYAGDSIEVDDSDFINLEKFVKSTNSITTLGKGQILETLYNAKSGTTR